MPTWTISAPKEFQESVRETAKKLGLSYGAYLRKAHEHYLKSLTSEDFERAKKLMELNQRKENLSVLRQKETIMLREKGYKDKNIQRILEDVDDPEIRKEILRLAQQREQEANEILRLHDELNPTSNSEKKLLKKMKMSKIYRSIWKNYCFKNLDWCGKTCKSCGYLRKRKIDAEDFIRWRDSRGLR
jgi:predicted DNA-binding protein